MSRKYERVQELLPIVKEMVNDGLTHGEIAEKLGFESKKVLENLFATDLIADF